jgi:hypothetical protein
VVLGAFPGDSIPYFGALGAYQLGDRQAGEEGNWRSVDPNGLDPVPAGPPTKRLVALAGSRRRSACGWHPMPMAKPDLPRHSDDASLLRVNPSRAKESGSLLDGAKGLLAPVGSSVMVALEAGWEISEARITAVTTDQARAHPLPPDYYVAFARLAGRR